MNMYTPQLLFGPIGPEILIIVALLVLLFGADRIPGIANSVGKSLGSVANERKEIEAEFDEVKKDLTEPVEETKQELDDAKKDLKEPIEETKQELDDAQKDLTEPVEETNDIQHDPTEQPQEPGNETGDAAGRTDTPAENTGN